MKFTDVQVGTTYFVSVPWILPSPTYEVLSGAVAHRLYKDGEPTGESRLLGFDPNEGATVVKLEKPWVIMELNQFQPRPVAGSTGWATDSDGEVILDGRTATIRVKPARIKKTIEEHRVDIAAHNYAAEKWNGGERAKFERENPLPEYVERDWSQYPKIDDFELVADYKAACAAFSPVRDFDYSAHWKKKQAAFDALKDEYRTKIVTDLVDEAEAFLRGAVTA